MPVITRYVSDNSGATQNTARDRGIQGINYAGNWDAARDDTSGTITSAGIERISMYQDLGRGGGTYLFRRALFCFYTGDISGTVNSADFRIYRQGTANGNFSLVKSGAYGGDGSTGLVQADMINYPGYSAGSTMSGVVTDYSSDYELSTVSINSYLAMTLNGNARTDIASNNVIILMLVNYEWDYNDTIPGTNPLYINDNYYSSNNTGTTYDPRLVIDYTPSSGYANDIIGVDSSNILSVDGVATADISEINKL